MSDDSPHPLPTWEEFASAQTGRWFFVKWMLAGGVVAALITAETLTRNLFPGIIWQWRMVLTVVPAFAALGLSQGWVVFRWRWRMWAWSPTWFLFFLVYETSKIHLIFLLIGFVQMLLLLGTRRRAVGWLLASQAGLEFYLWVAEAPTAWFDALRVRLGAIFTLPTWLDSSLPIQSTGLIFYFILTGAALAWLMPPVAPAQSASRPGGTPDISRG